ncbi:uncharacterized protein LOC101850189 [Aplysia californica]|uniref:Uncharacterized protein LOC101850189 n=1 Tax=Aplysia californica TaxID=6500 RepID=A0ABM0JF03_APLCA|nr:uncharacterized protein LOC101861493 [Aplysia californica]XP_035827075.1 uncharacterized protein LOC101850189 [Aplysia californica]
MMYSVPLFHHNIEIFQVQFYCFPFSGQKIQRIFFGSEHGKGEADGETGVINQAVDRAVTSGKLTVKDAGDLFAWCNRELVRSLDGFRREFFLVGKNEILRDRPETDVITIPGTRRIHQAERVSNYIIRTRTLACFCPACRRDEGGCHNQAYVGTHIIHKIRPSHPSVLNEAFLEDPEPSTSQHKETESTTLDRTEPRIGDFVSITYTVGRKQLMYNAVVIPPQEVLEDGELLVSFMRKQGASFIFPHVPEICVVHLEEVVVLHPPTIDNRGRHFFD